ncbi:acyltransferase family protein [Arsenicicoccus dermatophilus]|uniref:acyltransferase family protein n=1 Tax=Arsenicicoccus dermatophilus TaxID=1076331 RepID=UPI003917582D
MAESLDQDVTAAPDETPTGAPDQTQTAATGLSRRDTRPQHGGRLDALDGLRTIAVFLVVLFHAEVPGMHSGFLGVDLFFVLSGYLITAGLVRGLMRGRGAGLSSFWSRRFKRLLPAALLVCLAVLVWSMTLAPAYRRPSLGADLWWTSLYAANWHFIESAGYFAAQGAPSPLLHMWSLAVEEQFYLVWPLVLAATWHLLGRGHPGRARRAVLAVGVVLAVASAVLFVRVAGSGATDRAYMGSDTKAFEPLLGALVAVLLADPRAGQLARRAAPVVGWIGAVGLVLAIPQLGDSAGPSPWYFGSGAIIFSLLSAAVIVALARGEVPGLSTVLALPPVSYLGRISYGIYLWHWPVACWLPGEGFAPWRAVAVVVLSVLLAAASYHLVELPVRDGSLSRRLTPRRTLTSSAGIVGALALAAAVLGGTPASAAINGVVRLPAPPGDKVVLVVGDSVPQRLLTDLAAAADRRGLTLVSATAGGCSPLGAHTEISPGEKMGLNCLSVPDKIRTAVDTYHPGTVIWWSRYELADRYDGATLVRVTDRSFWDVQRRDLRTRIGDLTAHGATVVLVQTDRVGVGIRSRCTPQRCHPFLDRLVHHDELRHTWNDLVADVVNQDRRTRQIAIDDVYCHDAKAPCDDRVAGGVPARRDGSHFDDPQTRAVVAGALLDRAMAARPR